MRVTVRVPGSLKNWFQGSDETLCEGRTLAECIDNLDLRFSGIKDRLINEKGELSSVLLFLNGETVTRLEGLRTAVNDGDEIAIIPFAAGG